MFNWEMVKTGSWQKDLERLRSLKREITEAGEEVPVMAAYLHKRYFQKVQEMAPAIKAGVIAEQRAAVAAFEKADEASRQAYNKELARWNNEQYASARASVKARVLDIQQSSGSGLATDRKDKIEKLRDLQAELMASSDLNTRRACAEVFSEDIQEMRWEGTTRHGAPVGHSLGELVVSAQKALPAIRTIPEQVQALEQLQAAYNALADKQGQLVAVGKELGDDPTQYFAGGDPLARAYRSVRFSPDGGVRIFADDSVEVSGVDLSRLNLGGEK